MNGLMELLGFAWDWAWQNQVQVNFPDNASSNASVSQIGGAVNIQ